MTAVESSEDLEALQQLMELSDINSRVGQVMSGVSISFATYCNVCQVEVSSN